MRQLLALSVVVPTRNEEQNVRLLTERINESLGDIDFEVVFVDDSTDQTLNIIEELMRAHENIRLIHRQREERKGGLATAILRGFNEAKGRYLCVMDADFQHPPETILKLIEETETSEVDIVIASRYCEGGSYEGLSGPFRKFLSVALKEFARLVFFPKLNKVTDPLSGFFLVRRDMLQDTVFAPTGFKILLEILVRCQWETVREIPYRFAVRANGQSKATIRQGLLFLQHVGRLLWEAFISKENKKMRQPLIEKTHTPEAISEFLVRNKRFYLEEEEYDWVEVADHFVGLETLFHRSRAFLVRKLFRRFAVHGLCLDVGCGTGLILRHLPKGSIGIDLNPRNIRKVKQHAPNASVVQADMEALPFRSDVFDTVIATEVLEHNPNPGVTLEEIWRVLRSKGVLIGTIPSDSLIWKLRFLSRSCPAEEPYHKLYTRKEFLQIISALPLLFKVRWCRYAVPTPARYLSMNVTFVLQKP